MRLSRVPALTERQMAQLLASRLLRYADGPTNDPATWEAVCEALGITVQDYDVPGACPGEWSADIADGEPAVIGINRAYSAERQASAFVHELAELLMFRMQPPLLMDMSDGGRYDGEISTTQHRIARIVERLVVPHRTG